MVCIIHDMVSNSSQRIAVNLPMSTSCQDLLNEVTLKVAATASEVDLFYEPPNREREQARGNY
jgi:hypothetical protein